MRARHDASTMRANTVLLRTSISASARWDIIEVIASGATRVQSEAHSLRWFCGAISPRGLQKRVSNCAQCATSLQCSTKKRRRNLNSLDGIGYVGSMVQIEIFWRRLRWRWSPLSIGHLAAASRQSMAQSRDGCRIILAARTTHSILNSQRRGADYPPPHPLPHPHYVLLSFSLVAPTARLPPLEAYYNIAVTPWFRVTADIQYVEPVRKDRDDATFIGLRTQMKF